MSIPRRIAPRKLGTIVVATTYFRRRVREREREPASPLKTGGYQRERVPGIPPQLRDVGRGPLEESRGHSITF